MADIFLLSSFYTLRIIAGGIASDVAVSEWLMAFSVFFFTSLALIKRYTELARLEDEGCTQTAGRGYTPVDLSLMRTKS